MHKILMAVLAVLDERQIIILVMGLTGGTADPKIVAAQIENWKKNKGEVAEPG